MEHVKRNCQFFLIQFDMNQPANHVRFQNLTCNICFGHIMIYNDFIIQVRCCLNKQLSYDTDFSISRNLRKLFTKMQFVKLPYKFHQN